MANRMISLKAVLIILAFWCNSTYSQNMHLTFNGIALNGDAGTIYSNLVKKGFYQSTDKDYTVEGTFIIPKAHIEVLRTDESNKGYGVEISFTLPSKWGMEITKDTLVDYIKRTYKAVWAGGYGKDGYDVQQYVTPDKNKGVFILYHPYSFEGDNRKEYTITLALLDKSNYMNYIVSKRPHLDFLGIPINGTIDSFQIKLASKGILIDSKRNRYAGKGIRKFKGNFYGYKECEIDVVYHENNNIVFRVDVYIRNSPETNDKVMEKIAYQVGEYYKKGNLSSVEKWSSDYSSCKIKATRYNGEVEFDDNLGEINISSVSFTHNVTVSFGDDFNDTRYY